MKPILAAIVSGILCEALFVCGLMLGGVGPCGGASPLSIFVLQLHEPGLKLTSFLHIHNGAEIWLVMFFYAAIWSGLWYLFWRWKFRQKA